MSDKSAKVRERNIRSKRGNLQRRITFRITPKQTKELEKLIERGMNPSFEFRVIFDKMLSDARRRRI